MALFNWLVDLTYCHHCSFVCTMWPLVIETSTKQKGYLSFIAGPTQAIAAQSLWGFVCRKPLLLSIHCDGNKQEYQDRISEPIVSYRKKVHGFLVFQMYRRGGYVLWYEFMMNLGPDNIKRSGAGSEEGRNAFVKNTTSFFSFNTYCSSQVCLLLLYYLWWLETCW